MRRFGDVFRVRTTEADYVLKPLNKSRRRARYVCALMEYLAQGDHGLTPALARTADGGVMVSENRRRHWILCEWIGGRTCEWDDLTDARFSAAALGRFHCAARGRHPGPGESPKAYWHTWPEKLALRLTMLEQYVAEAKGRLAGGEGTRYDEVAAAAAPRQLALARRSLEVLLESDYSELCREAQACHQIIHGDPAGRNFVVTEYGQTRIIDLETTRGDIIALDVAKMLRRALKKHRWRPRVAEDLLTAYGREAPLPGAMMPVVWTFLAFPTKYYRDLERYYESRPGWSYRRHLYKLRKHLRGGARHDRLLDWFAERYLGRRDRRRQIGAGGGGDESGSGL